MKQNKFIALFCLLVALLAGASSSLFLYMLQLVTTVRQEHHALIIGLPIFGWLWGHWMSHLPSQFNQAVPDILLKLETGKDRMSFWQAPLVFLGATLTHLFGGSAGREGVGVVMSTTLTEKLYAKWELQGWLDSLREDFLLAAMAAGFSAMFGTPLAGFLFSFETTHWRNIRSLRTLSIVMTTSWLAYVTTYLLGPAHMEFVVPTVPYGWPMMLTMLIVGPICGLGANLYWGLYRLTSWGARTFIPKLSWRMFFGGAVVAYLAWAFASWDHIGIGTHTIQQSYHVPLSGKDFLWKLLLTALTLGVGFKGGEVTPLFFLGAVLANLFSILVVQVPLSAWAGLGMVSFFAAATHTPVASTILAVELFGARMGFPALGACFLATLLMQRRSVYAD